MTEALETALRAVDWNENVSVFLEQKDKLTEVDKSCQRIAVWSKQLENTDLGNPALSFVRALQSSAHHSVSSVSLGLYKASAASIRGIVENALYYTYFRYHPVELSSLVRNSKYYVSKSEVVEFHNTHTPDFKRLQEKFGLIGRMDQWYSEVSAVVHGQVPGSWVRGKAVSETKFDREMLVRSLKSFLEAEEIVHDLFLCTIGLSEWDKFSHTSKKYLLKGVSGDRKVALNFDSH